jgi:hypothetical protein
VIRAWLIAAGILLVGGLAGLVSLVLDLRAATAPPTPEAYVNASWTVYRFGPGHRTHVGNLHLACAACHGTTKTAGFDRPGPGPCASCHGDHADIQHTLVALDENDRVPPAGESGSRKLANCLACHGFGPDPDQKAEACLSCHAASQGELGAIVTHEDAPCTQCHAVHDNAVRPLPCTQCHEQKVVHAHPKADVASQCRDCHEVHAPAVFAEGQCRSCHDAQGEIPIAGSATFDGGHTCTGCHKPHDFQKQHAVPCRTCHEQLGMLQGHEQNECTSCHAPHAVRESVREHEPCASCHQDVKLTHQGKTPGEVGACTSCHKPHPTTQVRAQDACVTCHTEIGGAQHQAHASGVACTSCHQPHGFALTGSNESPCVDCHALERHAIEKNPGHRTCISCHTALPHGPDLTPVGCDTCHQEEKAHARKGHTNCLGCHEKHAGMVAGNVCESCHAEQAAHHPRGHDACTSCHDQHSGTLAVGVADCSACHEAKRLPGLHTVKEHAADCTNCHAPHGTDPPAKPAHCLSCHEDRKEHEPKAQVCSGCHTFIAPGSLRRLP